MAIFQAAEVKISSGFNGDFTQTIEKVQGININTNIPRNDIFVLGKTKPLNKRAVINYAPVSYSVDFVKGTKEVENYLGLLNPDGAAMSIGQSKILSGYGCRNLELLIIDYNNDIYKNQMNIKSGFLQSFSISATVGDVVKGSFAGEGLDLEIIDNNEERDFLESINDSLIKPENVVVSGINFSGFGITGLSIQSFNLSIQFNRQSVFQLGSKYPDRPLTDARANININGFIEGLAKNDSLSRFDCGLPDTGSYFLTITPSCSNSAPTTYEIKNPYIDTFTLGAQIGSFISTELSFSIPLPFNPQEVLTGSNLIIT